MNPRSLRHRLEKISKLLVSVQKHTPEVHCLVHEDKGEHGHVVLDFGGSGMSRSKMNALGKDLEGKGYRFTEKKSPWLGQTTYTGRDADKPTVIFTLPITKDRLVINDEVRESAYTFAS
jgi:hypothetical protein